MLSNALQLIPGSSCLVKVFFITMSEDCDADFIGMNRAGHTPAEPTFSVLEQMLTDAALGDSPSPSPQGAPDDLFL